MVLQKNNYLCLDVGDVRIGVARADSVARMATPLTTLSNNDAFVPSIKKIIEDEGAGTLVVGLPRNMNGDDTMQTTKVRLFADMLQQELGLPMILHDEALTSIAAKEELQHRNKPYTKSDVDSLAAAFILEDYLLHTSQRNNT